MSLYYGRGKKFTGIIAHSFTGSIGNVIQPPDDPTLGIVVLAYWLKVTGTSSAAPRFVSGTTGAALLPFGTVAAGDVLQNEPGEQLEVPFGESLTIDGGAASGVLFGYIVWGYRQKAVAA